MSAYQDSMKLARVINDSLSTYLTLCQKEFGFAPNTQPLNNETEMTCDWSKWQNETWYFKLAIGQWIKWALFLFKREVKKVTHDGMEDASKNQQHL